MGQPSSRDEMTIRHQFDRLCQMALKGEAANYYNVGMGEQKEYQIGVWGQRYKRHLKSNHRVIYYNYLTSGRLYEHLAEVDTRAEVMFHELVKTLAEKENVTEKLKAENTLLWIRKMNNIRNRATEIVNVEVIYV